MKGVGTVVETKTNGVLLGPGKGTAATMLMSSRIVAGLATRVVVDEEILGGALALTKVNIVLAGLLPVTVHIATSPT